MKSLGNYCVHRNRKSNLNSVPMHNLLGIGEFDRWQMFATLFERQLGLQFAILSSLHYMSAVVSVMRCLKAFQINYHCYVIGSVF